MATADILTKNEGALSYDLHADDQTNSSTATTTVQQGPSSDEMSKARLARMGSWVVRDDADVQPAYLSFRKINCFIKDGKQLKQLLTDVSGYCKPGEALAIMGPSGAGKSTLLDILGFRKTIGQWTQDVRINGHLLTKAEFVQQSGYVTSNDLMPAELTVRECLQFSANLRLPQDWTAAQREQRIQDVMEIMHLTNCQNSRVGSNLSRGLSTGERKRLAIALELLPVANVLFMDEPTTGLDSSTGAEVIQNVLDVVHTRKLACVATIHQPSYTILSQFDRLLLLADGKTCYFGTVKEAIPYFEQLGIHVAGNPAEIYSDCLAARPMESNASWEASPERGMLDKKIEDIHGGQGSIIEAMAAKASKGASPNVGLASGNWGLALGFYQVAPWWRQFWELFKRQMVIYSRNLMMSTSRLIGAICVGLWFGGAFFQSPYTVTGYNARGAMAYAMSLFPPLFGVAGISYWISNRKLFYQEEAAGMYHKIIWLLNSYVVEVIFLGVIMIVCILIFFGMAGWKSYNLGLNVGLIFFEVMAVTGFNLLCACIAPSIPYANAAFNLHYWYALVFGGYYVTDNFIAQNCGAPCLNFFMWISYARNFIKPTLRAEMSGEKLTCTQSELLPINMEQLTIKAMQAGQANLTSQWMAGNPGASPETIKALSGAAIQLSNVDGAQKTSTALGAAGVPQTPGFGTWLSTAQAKYATAFAAGTKIPPTDPQFTTAVGAAATTYCQGVIEENIKVLGLPDLSTCAYANGTAYLVASLGYLPQDFSYPAGTYMGVNVLLAVVTFILAAIAVWFCNFRKT